jgi:hemolysin activation/secretion protein
MGCKVSSIIRMLLCSILTITSAYAGPVGLPDSARPGAVRPEQEGRSDIPSKSVAEVLEVPAVIDRPFDVDEGEVIVVKEFRLLDGEDLPEYDISVDEVIAVLEEQRALRPEGFTIGQMQGAAEAVTTHYRKRGLVLAQAVVPVQTVSGGIVDIQIFVGRLGRVLAEGNKMYSKNILEKPFEKLIGEPITKAQVEAAMLTLTDYSGLSVFGVFQPGLRVGLADIVLKIQEEKRFDVAFRADDHGTRETGRNRLRTVIDWNNAMGVADRLTLSGQQAYNPKNNFFIAADYERFLANGYKVGGFVNVNGFKISRAFTNIPISAKAINQGIYLEKSFLRSRRENFSARFGFTRKKSQTITAGRSTNRDLLSVFSLSADYDSVDSFSLSNDPTQGGGGINFAYLEFSQGLNDVFGSMGSPNDASKLPFGLRPSRQGGGFANAYAAGRFNKIFASYTRLQTVRKNHSLLFRTEYQWSNDILVPLEQYSVGGPDNLRAFPVAQVLWDRAYFVSLEWLINAPFFADKPAFDNRTWGEILQFSMFFDQATGRLNTPRLSDQQGYESLRGAGFGLRFTLPGFIESKILWASEIGGNEVGDERNQQVWGDFTYRF